MSATAVKKTQMLVIGYGNPGRGDDAAGWRVAERIEELWGDRVETVTLHQLDVVLAERIAGCDLVVFVDAEASNEPIGKSPTRLYPTAELQDVGHTLNPETILGLGKTLYQAEPEAYLVTIAAHNFNFGEPLSAETEQDCTRAATDIEGLLKVLTHP
ncbi:MAG: hydrogenase maturation protease [bacterium]